MNHNLLDRNHWGLKAINTSNYSYATTMPIEIVEVWKLLIPQCIKKEFWRWILKKQVSRKAFLELLFDSFYLLDLVPIVLVNPVSKRFTPGGVYSYFIYLRCSRIKWNIVHIFRNKYDFFAPGVLYYKAKLTGNWNRSTDIMYIRNYLSLSDELTRRTHEIMKVFLSDAKNGYDKSLQDLLLIVLP